MIKPNYEEKYEKLKTRIISIAVASFVFFAMAISLHLMDVSGEISMVVGTIGYFWVFLMLKERIL